MRITIVSIAPPMFVARDVSMMVCVVVTVMVHGYANRVPGVAVGVVRDGQVPSHQQRLHEQAQTDNDSEESLHRVVPWFVLHSRRACEDWVFRSSSVAETILHGSTRQATYRQTARTAWTCRPTRMSGGPLGIQWGRLLAKHQHVEGVTPAQEGRRGLATRKRN